jgi:hypothetical protein
MEIDSKMLVASLRNYAEAKHMQLQDVGKQLDSAKIEPRASLQDDQSSLVMMCFGFS